MARLLAGVLEHVRLPAGLEGCTFAEGNLQPWTGRHQ
jgi:hypothetical protein